MRRLLILLHLAGLALPVSGQSNYAVIFGHITDSQHLPIAGVVIQLTAASTGAIRRSPPRSTMAICGAAARLT